MQRILDLLAQRDTRPLHRRREGMTLVEILIVVAILGSVMAIVAVNVAARFEEAKVGETKLIIHKVQEALNMYAAKHKGNFPPTSEGLEAIAKYTNNGKVPKDAWEQDFQYFSPGTNGDNRFEIISLGADGREGGEDNDADIQSWNMDD